MKVVVMANHLPSNQPQPGLSRRGGFSQFAGTPGWTPAVNLYEKDSCYVVCVDLAGVDKDKIDVEVHEGRLTLRGQRVPPNRRETPTAAALGHCKVHVMEIDDGPFARVVEIPADTDESRIIAQYRDGLLWIELPRRG